MTDINHRRKNRKPVNQRYGQWDYNSGYAAPENKIHLSEVKKKNDEWKASIIALGRTPGEITLHTGAAKVGRTDFLDTSGHGAKAVSKMADVSFSASIGYDHANGHKGRAKALRGAKKYVRTRIRFHENAKTKKLAGEEE